MDSAIPKFEKISLRLWKLCMLFGYADSCKVISVIDPLAVELLEYVCDAICYSCGIYMLMNEASLVEFY